jgi:hypothetical protein
MLAPTRSNRLLLCRVGRLCYRGEDVRSFVIAHETVIHGINDVKSIAEALKNNKTVTRLE